MVELVDNEEEAEANLNQLAADLVEAVRDITWKPAPFSPGHELPSVMAAACKAFVTFAC